jgi:MFS family permease
MAAAKDLSRQIYFAQFFSSASLFACGIFIPIVLERDMGANSLMIGMVVTGYQTALFVASVLIGRAADIRGRRRFLRLGFALSAIGILLQIVAASPISPVSSPFMLLIVRIMLGASAGMIASVLVAYFMYETKGKVGVFSSLGALGWGVGSIIAGAVGDATVIFAYSSGLMFMATIAVFALPKTDEVKYEVPLFPKRVFKENAAVYISVLVRHIGANFIWVTYPLFLMDILKADYFWVGIIYGVNAISQFLVMRGLDGYDSTMLVRVGLGLSAVTFLLFSLAQNFYEIIPLQVILAVSWASLYVGSLKYVTERSPEKATSMGWLQGMISIAGIIGPLLGGYLDIVIDYRNTILTAMVLSLAGLAIFQISKAMEKRRKMRTICP